jgi:FkbM family methyltransferase
MKFRVYRSGGRVMDMTVQEMGKRVSNHCANGVDEAVRQFLPKIGWACDVGASDGEFFSNTLTYEREGWTVLCVEPNPLLAEAGQNRRKLWRSVAAGPEDIEDGDFVAFGGPPYASSSALYPNRYKSGEAISHRFVVPVRRLDRILEEAGFHRLDYLTIDAEGYEPEIMKGFTIERWKPKVIVIETINKPGQAPAGYKFIERREHDDIFVREET